MNGDVTPHYGIDSTNKARIYGDVIGDVGMSHHQACIDPGIGAAGSGDGDVSARTHSESLLHHLLHADIAGLALPPVISGAAI